MDFFFSMDPNTLMYLGYSIAAIGTMAAGYWMTSSGISALALSQEDLESIGKGIMKGALQNDDLDSFLQCVEDPKAVISSIEGAVDDFQKNDMAGVTSGLFKIGDAVYQISKGIQTCDKDVSERELAILSDMFESFKHPKALAQDAGKNIIVNGVEIYREMSAAYTNYNSKEFEGFGRDIGIAMALVFIGAGDSQVSNGARQSAMTMVQSELYPTGINGDDNAGYVAFLSAIKTERDAAKSAGLDDGIVASVANEEMFYDAEEFLSLQNLMSKRNQASYLY